MRCFGRSTIMTRQYVHLIAVSVTAAALSAGTYAQQEPELGRVGDVRLRAVQSKPASASMRIT